MKNKDVEIVGSSPYISGTLYHRFHLPLISRLRILFCSSMKVTLISESIVKYHESHMTDTNVSTRNKEACDE